MSTGFHENERHFAEPDFSRPPLEIRDADHERILGLMESVWGSEAAREAWPELERILRVYHACKTDAAIADDAAARPEERFSERDVVLITYGDFIRSQGRTPLAALNAFLQVYMKGAINCVHILPFYPSSSDRGFSVMDYRVVDPRLGTWKDLHEIGASLRLMFDAVVNHTSAKGEWFREWRSGNPEYRDFFIDFDSADGIAPDDLAEILRPRTSDLLTRFDTIHGERHVWTTFSADQVDLNYANPRVLLRIVEVLLEYYRHGADIIRLDAVTYLWKQLGTSCANHEKAHEIVKLLRAVFDVVAPRVALITETNVPHEENIRYFGNGSDEAQMVYNFALPPLVLLSFLQGDCSALTTWARKNVPTSGTTTFFNFLDSHDGIGMLPIRDIVPPDTIDWMIDRIRAHGGLVSYRKNGDGTESAYELNCTWYSALNGEVDDDNQDLQVDRFVASRAVALSLAGVPGIYLPSLFGSKNDHSGVATGGPRGINRQTIDEKRLFLTLMDPNTVPHRIARRFGDLIRVRIRESAFHPNSTQTIVDHGSEVFIVARHNRTTDDFILALINVTAEPQEVRLAQYQVGRKSSRWSDLASEDTFIPVEGIMDVSMRPYQVMWLKAEAREKAEGVYGGGADVALEPSLPREA